jgi:hypothetical protein
MKKKWSAKKDSRCEVEYEMESKKKSLPVGGHIVETSQAKPALHKKSGIHHVPHLPQ